MWSEFMENIDVSYKPNLTLIYEDEYGKTGVTKGEQKQLLDFITKNNVQILSIELI